MPFTEAWLSTLADGAPAVDRERFVESDSPANADRWTASAANWWGALFDQNVASCDEYEAYVQQMRLGW